MTKGNQADTTANTAQQSNQKFYRRYFWEIFYVANAAVSIAAHSTFLFIVNPFLVLPAGRSH